MVFAAAPFGFQFAEEKEFGAVVRSPWLPNVIGRWSLIAEFLVSKAGTGCATM